MRPIYVSKTLGVAASTNAIGSLSTAAVLVVNSSNLGTQRRITVWPTSGGGDVSASFTIIGTQEGGVPQRETITGSTGGGTIIATTQDFLTVTTVQASCSPLTLGVTFGTNTQGGSRWVTTNDAISPMNLGFALSFSSSAAATVASLEYTLDDPTSTVSSLPYNTGPKAFISTAASSVAITTTGLINFPVAAWRVTYTSTSTTTSMYGSVIQSGR